ncbi:hypothetical protein D8S78_19850 [Natrialba swarupiae]|nr:hypothetical protein [Natrialba swarupiae]
MSLVRPLERTSLRNRSGTRLESAQTDPVNEYVRDGWESTTSGSATPISENGSGGSRPSRSRAPPHTARRSP